MRVMVVGCGGLGGFVIEELARIGVRDLVLVDGDTFCESNLNRQLESGLDTLGRNKAEVYGERLRNKWGREVGAIPDFLSERNAHLVAEVDLVMDCVDTIEARLLLEKICAKYDKILVHGGLEGSCGQACLCYPDEETLARLYGGKQEEKHSTNVCTVATVASLQVELVRKLLLGEEEQIKGKLVLANLDSFAIDVVNI